MRDLCMGATINLVSPLGRYNGSGGKTQCQCSLIRPINMTEYTLPPMV